MIFKLIIGLLVLAALIYYLFCFLQIFGAIRFTRNEVKIPQMFIPFYYLLKKDPEPEPEPEPKKKKPSYTKPIKTKDNQ